MFVSTSLLRNLNSHITVALPSLSFVFNIFSHTWPFIHVTHTHTHIYPRYMHRPNQSILKYHCHKIIIQPQILRYIKVSLLDNQVVTKQSFIRSVEGNLRFSPWHDLAKDTIYHTCTSTVWIWFGGEHVRRVYERKERITAFYHGSTGN